MISAADYTARQSEADFQATVIALAERLGWLVFHWPNAVMNPVWPDLTLIRDGRVIFAELKRENGIVGAKQQRRLWELAAAGMTVYVWRPSMGDELERILRGDAV